MSEKLLKIINHYGVMHQLKYFQSEVFELNEAIFQYEAQKEACENIGCSRIHIDKCKEHISEEIADVEVMLLQFKEYYHIDWNEILEIMNKKIDRQLKRMENEK
jgi:NTP pyrophosphatase (non-canonical NTP hydrolase)